MEKILIVDDHPIFVDGMTEVIKDIFPGSDVVTCNNGHSALSQIHKAVHFDWIFLDVNLPDISGFELLKQFLELKLLSNVIIVSSDESPETIHTVLELHANGFISKQFNRDLFNICIRSVEMGDIYLDNQLTLLLKNYREGIYLEQKYIQEHIRERQLEALQMIERGMSNQEIAELMNITKSTVKTHISTLMELFNVDNRSRCVAEARRLGFLQ